jgi:hypothetical protein
MDTLKVKKAWEVALGPIKSLPMTGIMMYMSGNSLQIFSIMMVFMAFKNPIMGILGTNQAFERFETDSNRAKIVQVKLAYVAMQLVALALGIWKVNGMGLFPWVCRAPFGDFWLTRRAEQRGRTGSPGRRSVKPSSTRWQHYKQARLGQGPHHLLDIRPMRPQNNASIQSLLCIAMSFGIAVFTGLA